MIDITIIRKNSKYIPAASEEIGNTMELSEKLLQMNSIKSPNNISPSLFLNGDDLKLNGIKIMHNKTVVYKKRMENFLNLKVFI